MFPALHLRHNGASKGVMLCHRNFCSEVMAAMGVIKISPEDCGISMLPLHHTYESTIILFFCPYCGAKVTFCDGFKYVLKNMKEFKPLRFRQRASDTRNGPQRG